MIIEKNSAGIIVHYGEERPSWERCDIVGTLPNGKTVESLCVLKKGHSCHCAMNQLDCERDRCEGCHLNQP